MQIQSIINFKQFTLPLQNNQSRENYPKYNLSLQSPLTRDTVSFKALQQTVKGMANRSEGISIEVTKQIRKLYEKPHAKLKKLLVEYMGDIFTPESQEKYFGEIRFPNVEKGLVGFGDRIKGENSLAEKTATLKLDKKKEVMANIRDISGFCFILEDKNSFKEFVKRFCSLIEKEDFDPIEVEYHRLAPKIRRGKVEESYDSLDIGLIEKIKSSIIKTKNPTTQFCVTRDSMSGYSGLHVTVRNSDGTYSEIQIMLRGVHEIKDKAENASYKIRNGKSLTREYRTPSGKAITLNYEMLERAMAPLRKKDVKKLSPKEAQEQNAFQAKMTEYTQEAYIDAIQNHPYDRDYEFLRPKHSILDPFDFNIIAQVKALCEKIHAEKISKILSGEKPVKKSKGKK